MRFSDTEITQLLKAWAAISFAFAISLGGLGADFGWSFLMAGLTVGIAFLLHELAHKFMAQKYGCWAEFRSFDLGLVLAIGMALLTNGGFIFAAPGAVMISGLVTTEENGKIAAIGPVTNIVLAILFFVIGNLAVANGLSLWLVKFASYGFAVNSWLAVFNLIPLGPLDGVKVMNWSRPIWLLLLGIAGFMTFFL